MQVALWTDVCYHEGKLKVLTPYSVSISPKGRKEDMNEETRKKIIQWIFDNHDHHELADEEPPEAWSGCADKDLPYVNSVELEKFIQSL